MNSQRLKYFITAAETLNLTKTAKIHYISQTAVTGQIKALEADLGVMLFDREGKRIKLTPSGTYFYQQMKKLMEQEEEICRKTRQMAESRPNRLILGLVPECGDTLVQRILLEYRARRGDVELSFRTLPNQKLIEWVLRGELDASFAFLSTNCKQPVPETYIPLEKVKMGILVPAGHPLANRREVGAEDMRRETAILLTMQDEENQQRDFYGLSCCNMLCRQMVADSLDSMGMMVKTGMGVGVLTSFHARSATKRFGLVFVPTNCKKAEPTLALVLPSGVLEGERREFADFCQEYARVHGDCQRAM